MDRLESQRWWILKISCLALSILPTCWYVINWPKRAFINSGYHLDLIVCFIFINNAMMCLANQCSLCVYYYVKFLLSRWNLSFYCGILSIISNNNIYSHHGISDSMGPHFRPLLMNRPGALCRFDVARLVSYQHDDHISVGMLFRVLELPRNPRL